MVDADFDRFRLEFQRLSAALHGFKQSAEEARSKLDAYFHVLKKLSLSDVIAKADRWLATETKMPKPAEWAGVVIVKSIALPVLSHVQATAWLRAEALRWEDAPCTCAECREADVHEKPLRFVPEFTDEDRDRRVVIGERAVTAGHWAHGYELARYYQAQANFWNAAYTRFGGDLLNPDAKRKQKPFLDRLQDIVQAATKNIPKGKHPPEQGTLEGSR